MRGLGALIILAVTAMSLGWTTWKSRRLLRNSLGREPRPGEDTSLRTWMQLSDNSLDEAARELEANPFEDVLSATRTDMGRPSEDHPSLK